MLLGLADGIFAEVEDGGGQHRGRMTIAHARDQMIERGILLCREPNEGHPVYNPMHPDVIRYYREHRAR